MITNIEKFEHPFKLVNRVIKLFELIFQLEEQIEQLRVLICEDKNFDLKQIFETIKMDSYQSYIDDSSLKSFLNRYKIQVKDIEVQNFLYRFSDNNNFKIYLHNLNNIILPHDDIILANQVLENKDMKNGGPREIFSYEMKEKLRSLFQAELFYFNKVNRCKIELFRDFQWDIEDFPLCQFNKLTKLGYYLLFTRLQQWLQNNLQNEQFGALIWRRLFNLNKEGYLPNQSMYKNLLGFLLPDDYHKHLSQKVPKPLTEQQFVRGSYHQQRDYLNNQRKQLYVTQDWKDGSKFISQNVNFYNNSNNIKPYQWDVYHIEYRNFQEKKIKQQIGIN